MSSFEKLKLLIWKNFLLQRRHKWQTIFEIASPVIFSLFLILIRCLVDPKSKPDLSYPSFIPTYFNISGRQLGNLTTVKREGTLAFSPENPLTRKVTEDAMAMVALDNLNAVLAFLFDTKMLPEPKGYNNSIELGNALAQPNVMNHILVGIQFPDTMANATEWPDDITVTLRFPAVMRTPMVEHPLRASWRTNLLFPVFPRPGPREPDDMYGGKTPGYSPEMFLAVQHAVSQKIIKHKTGKSINTKVYLQRLPQLAYRDDDLLIAMEKFISMIIMLCFAYSFVNTVKVVTAEKELQLKETMTIMGLPSWLHWLAWFIKQFSFLFISVILMVILFKIPFNATSTGDRYSVLTFTPWTILVFFMVLFVMASLAFCFMVSVLFTRANTAAAFMGLAWFSTYAVFMLSQVLYEELSLTTKMLLSLISNTAMGYAFQMIVMAEGTSKGLRWDMLFSPITYHDQFIPAHVIMMLLVDTVLYMVIAMYLEKIRPGLYGVPLPWYFPFTKSYWFPNKHKSAAITNKEGIDKEYQDALLEVVHDEEPKGVPMGINIENLTKVYKGKKKVVDNLTLRMYENEITVLLGHNGAGKTTTISMLTGMVPPTSGSAMINGYNVVTETEQARKSLGLCPQHNVLFPDLTVAEHIRFYSRLKGVHNSKIDEEVNHFVNLLELTDKRDVVSRRLSGGQQRRLAVGAAMCGASRVVLLDEPTSGLDPAARRALWDLLQKEKRGRTMILTTHFMDEADVLGDRIAIMSGGRLQCVGTPYFLKRHYGIGYKLTIVKNKLCKPHEVLAFLKGYVPDVKLNTNIGSELTFTLPKENIPNFPEMLRKFDEEKDSMGIASYGLSVTSLEEVFMKAGIEERDENGTAKGTSSKRSTVGPSENEQQQPRLSLEPIQQVRGAKLVWNHYKAMFLKLAYYTFRNKLAAFIQFVTPIINITVSVIIARSWKFISQLPPLELSLEKGFKNTQTLISETLNLTESSLETKALLAYKDYFKTASNPEMTLNDIGNMDLGKYYLKLSESNLPRVRYENLVGATFAPNRITGWFSNYGYHDSAISLALVNNAILRALSPNSTLRIVNYPLPYSIDNLVRVMATGSSMGFQFAFNIGFCMAFVTAFLVLFVIKERRSGAALLQRVAGLRAGVQWSAALLWDWLWLVHVSGAVVLTLAAFQENTLSTPAELSRVMLVLIIFTLATIPLHYLASFYFEAAATGFSKLCFLNIFSGCMPFLITEVLRLPEVGSPYFAHLFDWLFSPLPIYCLSRSFRDMSVSSFAIMACDGLCDQFVNINNCTRHTLCDKLNISVCCIHDNPYLDWSEPGIGRYLFMMMLVGTLAFIVLLLKEYKVLNKVCYWGTRDQPPVSLDEEDSDVTAERRFVDFIPKDELDNYSLVCKDLTKYYKDFVAVNRLSFAVRDGECFGLLGVNGAGKTSTFRMLTGDARVSAGAAHVRGFSVRTQLQDAYRQIGYCPQFDALFDNLTAKETLDIFCLLRGIPDREGTRRARELASMLGFEKHFHKKVNECSGGTKRKLSTALALLGDSPLIFLDEPTTGMDPASKRLVWACVQAAAGAGRSVVLTSHSMEECEALCTRLTIMVKGRFHCLGPLQHLKNKFSQGYTLMVKCTAGPNRDAELASMNQYVLKNFKEAKLIETYLGISTYYLNDAETPWWRVFYIMEESRSQFQIEDYSVSQTTLEQVFLRFSRMHGNAE